jgi:hypothetical protein
MFMPSSMFVSSFMFMSSFVFRALCIALPELRELPELFELLDCSLACCAACNASSTVANSGCIASAVSAFDDTGCVFVGAAYTIADGAIVYTDIASNAAK